LTEEYLADIHYSRCYLWPAFSPPYSLSFLWTRWRSEPCWMSSVYMVLVNPGVFLSHFWLRIICCFAFWKCLLTTLFSVVCFYPKSKRSDT